MKLRLIAEIIEDSGERVTKAVEKEAKVPGIEEFRDSEQFYEIFDRYEQSALKARNELLEELTKEYLEESAALKKGRAGEKL